MVYGSTPLWYMGVLPYGIQEYSLILDDWETSTRQGQFLHTDLDAVLLENKDSKTGSLEGCSAILSNHVDIHIQVNAGLYFLQIVPPRQINTKYKNTFILYISLCCH